ncbi:MAG: hypothetical protein L0228_15915 [Planctomycetes bacterium]|nr:hypothetical protein [Planctomycetota bacterium]
MRTVFLAVGLVGLIAATAAAQLLDNGTDEPADKAAPGRPAADAKRDGNAGRPLGGPAARPQPNAMFAAMDADGDGVISKLELRNAIKALKTLDTDNDGSITLAEASVGGGPVGPGGPLGEDPQIAQLMANDRNNDGKLTPNEVPNEMIPMLQGVDQNNDRAIDRQELAAAMANMRNQFGVGPGGPWRGGPGGVVGGARDAAQATGRFLQSDKNGDGRLTEDELSAQDARMLQGADRNKDGAIDAGELQAALAQLGDRARAFRAGAGPDGPRGRNNDDRARKRPGDEN